MLQAKKDSKCSQEARGEEASHSWAVTVLSDHTGEPRVVLAGH